MNRVIRLINRVPGVNVGNISQLSATTPGGGVPDWAIPVPARQQLFMPTITISGREVHYIVEEEVTAAERSADLTRFLGAIA